MFSSRVRGRTNLRAIPPRKKSGVINFASFFTPANVLQSVQSDLGLTVVGGNVTAWADQSGNGKHYSQATTTQQPKTTVGLNGFPGVLFDGVDDYLASALNLPSPSTTPTWIGLVFRQITWLTQSYVVGDSAAQGHLIYQNNASPQLRQYDGVSGNLNGAIALNTWECTDAQYQNTTADYLRRAASIVTGASAGNLASTGRGLGASTNNFNFSNIEVLAAIYVSGVPSAGQLAAWRAAVVAKYGNFEAVYGSPLSIFGAANVIQWVRADKGITTATGVSGWADQSASGNNYAQVTGSFQPAYNAADSTLNGQPTITFDGVDDTLVDAGFTLPSPATTPTCALAVAKYISYSGQPALFGDASNTAAICLVSVAANTVRSQAGSVVGPVTLNAGSWARIRADFSNSVSDVLRVGSNQVTGNAGSSTASGRAIGTLGSGFQANVAVYELVYLKAIPTVAQMAAYDAYVTALTNGAAAV